MALRITWEQAPDKWSVTLYRVTPVEGNPSIKELEHFIAKYVWYRGLHAQFDFAQVQEQFKDKLKYWLGRGVITITEYQTVIISKPFTNKEV